MGRFFKEFMKLMFSAQQEVTKKAEEFRKQRHDRFDKFKLLLESGKVWKEKKTKSTGTGPIEKIFNTIMKQSGFAPPEEVRELKRQIDELAKKVDQLTKGKDS